MQKLLLSVKRADNVLLAICLLCIFSLGLSATAAGMGLPASVKKAASFASTDTATAVFKSNTNLVLDTKAPLGSFYVADISILKFANPLEGDIFFNKITDNLLSYKVDYKANTVVINLHLAYANPAWTVADWNNYINSKLNP